MDQHYDVLATYGWRTTRIDWQAESAQLRDQLDNLHETVDRLHALAPQFAELLKSAQRHLQDVHASTETANEAVT